MQWGCRGMQPSQQQPLWQTKADHGRPSHCDMCGATSISDAFLKYVIQVCRNQSHGRKLQMFLIGAFRFGVGMKKKTVPDVEGHLKREEVYEGIVCKKPTDWWKRWEAAGGGVKRFPSYGLLTCGRIAFWDNLHLY